ncbi:Glycoside hydrolase family 76 protein [Mycena kentingensis (nom. inval.)]|nr:Glycoside hydrolase family 76 protein [Mycena kentingensis (nom. inval.)]
MASEASEVDLVNAVVAVGEKLYIMYLTAMQNTEESLRLLGKGKNSTFSRFGGGANAEADRRIQTIDVDAFGMDAKSLDVDLEMTKMVNFVPEVRCRTSSCWSALYRILLLPATIGHNRTRSGSRCEFDVTGTLLLAPLPLLMTRIFGCLFSKDLAPTQQATDYAVWMHRFAGPAFTSYWFAGVVPDFSDPKSGDPRSERIPIDSPPQEVVVEAFDRLGQVFSAAVAYEAVTMDSSEPLIIVLCGHGDPETGALLLGGEEEYTLYPKEALESALGGSNTKRRPENTIVILPACLSARWSSPKWTLFCATEYDQVASTIASTAITGNLTVFAPSPAKDTLSAAAIGAALIKDRYTPILTPLDDNESAELLRLSRRVVHHPSGALRDTPGGMAWAVISDARTVVKSGVGGIPVADSHRLLNKLRRWIDDCERVTKIAAYFGWHGTVSVEDWSRAGDGREMKEAENAGARIFSHFFLSIPQARWYLAPGAWLAHLWVEAGRPIVKEKEWDAALASCTVL